MVGCLSFETKRKKRDGRSWLDFAGPARQCRQRVHGNQMAPKHISGSGPSPAPYTGPEARARDTVPGNAPGRERRSRDRVTDDQKSGQGAMSALSRLQMIERRRAVLEPDPSEPGE
jgi:hypothetical protein